MTTRKFETGMRSAEVTHYSPGSRRKLEFIFDGMDTVDAVLKVDNHGQRPETVTLTGIALNEDEVYQLTQKLTDIWTQMAEERKKREEWQERQWKTG